MRKIILYLLGCSLISVLLWGCSVKNTEFYYAYDSFDEYITVGNYSTQVDKNSADYFRYEHEIFDNAFGDTLDTKVTMGNVQMWDETNINYICRLNGKEVDGGLDMNYTLTVGFGDFGIDAFEQQLVGAPIGKTTYFDIVIDEDYFNKEIAGKEVQFEVFVNYVMRRKSPTDADAVKAGFTSLEEYEKDAERKIVSQCLFDAAYDATSFHSFPEKETKALLDSVLDYYERDCDKKGITLEQYAASMSFTLDEYKAKLTEGIQKNYTNMPRDLVSNYILSKYNQPLSKEDIRNTRNDIIREIETSLEEAGYSEIEIQRRAAYEKALDVLYNEFG